MDDWSPHLQNVSVLEKHATNALNERQYIEAADLLKDLIEEAALALAWTRRNLRDDRGFENLRALMDERAIY
jgi:hypothetical protein